MIELNWTLFLQAANFLLLLFVLNFILYRPLRDILQKRRESVEGAHRRARELEGDINEKMARYQERLQEAKLKGSQEKMKLRQEALEEEGKLLAAAHGSASAKLQEIKGRVAEEAEQARRSLRSETETLAAQVASKVLGRAL